MRAHVLIDLYVPARLGSPDELQFVAQKSGLDAVIRVAEDPSERPTPDELGRVAADGPLVIPAVAVSGPGFRFACVLPEGQAVSLDSLEATGDARLIQSAVASLGGVALPVAPRRGPAGTVAREATELLKTSRVGVAALTVPGSFLGRDLDLEDAVIAERVVLGASGPFASLSQVGRFASLLPVKDLEGGRPTVESVIAALASGVGFAVEVLTPHQPVAQPDPHEGREEGTDTPHKRRRRRRKKKGG